MLTGDDWAFIKDISDRFPDRTPSIYENFVHFENLPPQQRLKEANKALKQELRRGFVQRIQQGITPCTNPADVENIHQHSKNMRLILRRIFNTHKDHPFLQGLGEQAKKDMLKKAFRLAAVHDLPEAITSDFTPVDMRKISPEIKHRLEDLASLIIFEAFPRKKGMINRYEAKGRLKSERNIDHLNKVIDLLEGGVDCLAMNASDACFDEWMSSIQVGLKKYQDLSLCFATQSLTSIRSLRESLPDLIKDYPDVQERRVAIIDLVFGEAPENTRQRRQMRLAA